MVLRSVAAHLAAVNSPEFRFRPRAEVSGVSGRAVQWVEQRRSAVRLERCQVGWLAIAGKSSSLATRARTRQTHHPHEARRQEPLQPLRACLVRRGRQREAGLSLVHRHANTRKRMAKSRPNHYPTGGSTYPTGGSKTYKARRFAGALPHEWVSHDSFGAEATPLMDTSIDLPCGSVFPAPNHGLPSLRARAQSKSPQRSAGETSTPTIPGDARAAKQEAP